MKFGKLLRRQELRTGPCAGRYVDYKRLKGLIKKLLARDQHMLPPAGQHSPQQPQRPEERYAEFFQALETEAARVDHTYGEQAAALRARLTPLVAVINDLVHAGRGVDHAVVSEFGTLCQQLDNLRAYTLLNYMAFCKAMKKFDKKILQAESGRVLTELQERSFYRSEVLAQMLTDAEMAAAVLSGEQPREEDFQCGICLGVLANPVVLTCAHKYCWSCLAKAAHFGEACPTCRKQLPLDPRHYRVDTTLQNFLREYFPDQVRGEPSHATEFARDDDDDESDAEGAAPKGAAPPAGGGTDADGDVCMGSCAAAEGPTHDELTRKPAPGCTAGTQQQAQQQEGVRQEDPFAAVKPPRVVQTARLEAALEHCKPGSYVALDLDETVVMAPAPSSMFSPRGVELFQEEVRAMPAAYQDKVEHCRRFQALLDEKVPVQRNTVELIREMQRRGCWVFGLTARYSSMARRTQVTLFRLGLELGAGQPDHLPSDHALQDPDTAALYSSGVIYTNAVDKGVVLDRFLQHVVGLGERAEVPVPPSIVFVDDRVSNCESVLNGLPVAGRLGVPVHSYHYTGAANVFRKLDPSADPMLRHQIRHFLHRGGEVLGDDAARAALGMAPAAAAGGGEPDVSKSVCTVV